MSTIDEIAADTADVVIDGVSKAYGPNLVLKGVSLTVRAGEIHTLLGPNGSGKSTLLACLSGATKPDSGTIRIGGKAYSEFTPTSAFAAGTGIIYQHFQVIGELSVADNIFLGSELRTSFGGIDYREQRKRTAELLALLRVDLDPRELVGGLSTGQQQIVEIAKALRRNPSLLIFDEPTAALSAAEVAVLTGLVKRLAREQNIAIIYVTHLLREVMEIADTVTVLIDGELYWTRPICDLSLEDLIAVIAPGRKTTRTSGSNLIDFDDRPTVLELRDFASEFTGPIDLSVRRGEIVGVFGLLGSGRTSLVETIVGVQRRLHGTMTGADGRHISARAPRSALRQGIALVASDRREQSLFGEMSAQENVLMPYYPRVSRPLRVGRAERAIFDRLAEQVQLRPRKAELEAGRFSGGNAQKLAVGRWLTELGDLSVLLLDEPTQGVDKGAREEIYGLLRTFVAEGERGVIFTTSDPEEALALADRILVLSAGSAVETVGADVDELTLLRLAHSEEHETHQPPISETEVN